LLVEFSSVVDALRCVTEVQAGMVERNAGVPPDGRIEFRIGTNVGDIVVEDGDIFGDGVNVAARLEAVAEPGGISVSARPQQDSASKLDLVFEDMGEQQLKKHRTVGARGPSSRRYQYLASRFSAATPRQASIAVFPSPIRVATRNRNISPTAWSRRSLPRCRVSAGSSSSPVIRVLRTKGRQST
jgi:hypothetical protein